MRVKQSVHKEILESDEYLRDLVFFLTAQYHPLLIYLFGSKARGEATEQSDYDLLVVVKKKPTFEKRRRVHRAKWRAGLRKASDVVLFSNKGFEDRLEVKNSLPATVMEEGKLLYAA